MNITARKTIPVPSCVPARLAPSPRRISTPRPKSMKRNALNAVSAPACAMYSSRQPDFHQFVFTLDNNIMKRLESIKIYFEGKKVLRIAIFSVGGAIAGFLYYKFVGCRSGTCPITSNPYISTFWGALIGFLFSI